MRERRLRTRSPSATQGLRYLRSGRVARCLCDSRDAAALDLTRAAVSSDPNEHCASMKLMCIQMNPFISFCLYVAARVFVQYLKSRPKDTQIKASLQFLLSAMHAIKRKNPLTESFLVQLDVDLEGAGLDSTTELRASVPLQSQRSTQFAASQGCPNTAVRDGDAGPSSRPPVYGDIGLAAYNDPNAATSIPVTTDAPVKGSTFGAYSVPGLRGQSNGLEGFQPPGNAQFELQNRQQRSPGSQQSSGISPRPYNPDMDTSPDASGSNDRPTPNSSTHSQHNFSSHTSIRRTPLQICSSPI